jgi:hypothetical protein
MVECVECGKRLRFFEGYSHPTLGKKSIVCGPCFLRVEKSVAQWREFILSNSFDQVSSKPTVSIDRSALLNSLTGIKKQFTATEETHHSSALKSKSHRDVVLNHLNYHKNETLVKMGRRTV